MTLQPWGIFGKSAFVLAHRLAKLSDAFVCLRNVPLHDFQSKVGTDSGSWIYNVLRGVEYGEGA